MDPSNDVPHRPKRPLTAYNLFSILERNYIVQQAQKRISSSILLNPCDPNEPYVAERPKKYRNLVLPRNWYLVGTKKKKKSDRQIHGAISFKDLSKTVSVRWKSADEEVKAYCKKIGAEELRKYRINQTLYKEKYGTEAFEAQKRTYKKRPNINSITQDDKRNSKNKHKNNEGDCTGDSETNAKLQNRTDLIKKCSQSSIHFLSSTSLSESLDEGVIDMDKVKRRGSGDSAHFSLCEWIDIGEVAAKAFDRDEEDDCLLA